METKKYPFEPSLPIPPGETIRQIIDHLGMSQAELALRLGYSRKHVNQLLQGVASVTPEAAVKLESVLGPPASFWNNVEREYRELQARAEQETALRDQLDIVKPVPYKELVKGGWLPETRSPIERARNLLRFFGVASLDMISIQYEAAFRHAARQAPSQYAMACWLRLGELVAAGRDTAPYSESGLRKAIPDIRGLSRLTAAEFESRLVDLCAENGVVLVFLEHLPKTYAHGATRWLTDSRALVQLSIRGKYADIFWFSLFHELGHVLLGHSKKKVFIAGEETSEEKDADRFASDRLIPPKEYAGMRNRGDYRSDSIRNFAEDIGVHPGIVVGRLQHDGLLKHSQLNFLRTRLQWVESEDAPSNPQ